MLNYISPEILKISLERHGLSNLFALTERLTSRERRGPAPSAPDWLKSAAADGDNAAQTQLAEIMLQATPNDAGFATAKPLLENAAENGYGPAQYRLGFLHLFGLENPSDYVKAEYYLRAAAANGEKDAQLYLSLLLASGTGPGQPLDEAQRFLLSSGYLNDKNTETLEQVDALGIGPALASFCLASLALFVRAVSCLPDDASTTDLLESLAREEEAGDENAMLLRGLIALSEGQAAEAWRHCRNAANANQPLACLIMAFQAFANHGAESEGFQRDQWLDSAVAADLTLAKLFLALTHIQGDRKDADIEIGRKLFVEFATQTKLTNESTIDFCADVSKPENLHACALIWRTMIKMQASHLLSNGWLKDEIKPDELRTEILRLASEGDVVAQYVSAVYFRDSSIVDADLKQSAHWLKMAAERGHREAQYKLARAYGDGQGVDKDADEEIHWLRLAAQQGHIEAASHLSLVLSGNDRSESDLCEAVKWLKVSAESGDPIDQVGLGLAYSKGRGIEQNSDKALFWWKQSAEQGNAQGQTLAGRQLVKDASNPGSFREGLFWLEKAAEQGEAPAQYRLGVAIVHTLKQKANNSENFARTGIATMDAGLNWMRKSADQGFEPAKKTLENMESFQFRSKVSELVLKQNIVKSEEAKE